MWNSIITPVTYSLPLLEVESWALNFVQISRLIGAYNFQPRWMNQFRSSSHRFVAPVQYYHKTHSQKHNQWNRHTQTHNITYQINQSIDTTTTRIIIIKRPSSLLDRNTNFWHKDTILNLFKKLQKLIFCCRSNS